jgi:2-dehydropantoate 2-reductase
LIGSETIVIFAMNGIPWYLTASDDGAPRPDRRTDPGGVLSVRSGWARRRLHGQSANAIAEPGVIRNSPGTKNRFTLGEPDGTISPRLQTISQAFERAGIPSPMTATIRVDIWDKLVRNLVPARSA